MNAYLEEKEIQVKKEKRSFIPKLRMLSNQLAEIESELSLFWKLNPAILITIKNGKIIRCNPSVTRELGYEEELLQNQKLIDIVHPDDRKKTFLVLNALKNKLEMQEVVLRLGSSSKESWIFAKISLSYEPKSNTIFCTAFPLKAKCQDCPYTS